MRRRRRRRLSWPAGQRIWSRLRRAPHLPRGSGAAAVRPAWGAGLHTGRRAGTPARLRSKRSGAAPGPPAGGPVVLATKCGHVLDDLATKRMHRDGSPGHIRAAVRASLSRLGTDVIDLYYLHRVDGNVPLAESWGAMSELVAAGLVRSIGLSEVTVEQAVSASAFQRRGGRSRVERGRDCPVGRSTGCDGRAVLMVTFRSAGRIRSSGRGPRRDWSPAKITARSVQHRPRKAAMPVPPAQRRP
jgi:hypothetical protein